MDHHSEVIRQYLSEYGYAKEKIKKVTKAYDLSKPVYKQRIEKGSIIYQFVRRPSFNSQLPKIGNWFCLIGASMNRLAIISGGEGREIAEIKVLIDLDILEGTASPQSVNWGWSGGGDGGATQIFLPSLLLMTHIKVIGYRENKNGRIERA